MKLKKKKKIKRFLSGDGQTEKMCYVCGKKIKPTQKYYAIGKVNGKEWYRHQRCKANDYKGDKK